MTAFITQCSLVALSLALVACGSDRQGSTIRHATIADSQLTLDLALRFTATELEALDHGIPLRLALTIAPSDTRYVELRYRPLARQYEMQLPGAAVPRLHASRARLLAALDRIVIDDVTANDGDARVALVSSALPAPLRLPALIDRDWQLATPALHWSR